MSSRSEHRQRRERLSARVDPEVAEIVERVAEAEHRPVNPAPSAPVVRRTERVESGFRELSATTPHPVAEIRS